MEPAVLKEEKTILKLPYELIMKVEIDDQKECDNSNRTSPFPSRTSNGDMLDDVP